MAQQTLQGKISDQANQQPVAGATVYIPDLKKGAVSDVNGFYKLEHLPKGKFLVQFKFVGYSPEVRGIDLDGVTTYDIEFADIAQMRHETLPTRIFRS